jgi:hypothetical protein
MKFFGMLLNRLRPYHERDWSAGMRQASSDQAAETAGSKDRVPHWLGNVL